MVNVNIPFTVRRHLRMKKTTNRFTRILSLMLALVMVLTMLPTGLIQIDVFADNGAEESHLSAAANGTSTAKSGYSVTVHYFNSDNWNAVHNYVWDNGGKNDYCSYWPGRQIAENPDHLRWYDLVLEGLQTQSINCIFNNGDDEQTEDIAIDLSTNNEFWYMNGQLYTTAPATWNQTYPDSSARKFYVPGTFPGNLWDAGSNRMTYTGKNGVYQYTFKNVPAGTYEFKISVNGSWTENYGYGGLPDGKNYSVTLSKAQDLTIWYSDVSHFAVTSQEYDAAMTVTLSGTGVPATRLHDPRLSGIFSATVNLVAGSYSDLKVTAGSDTYKLPAFTLSAPTAVTFFLNPASGLCYHNITDGTPIDGSKVYYNTKDTTFKSIMGAVPNNAETTFRIQTGTDVCSAEMVIGRGAEVIMNVTMTAGKPAADGTVLWACNPNFRNSALGDNYWYYFVLRNVSGDVKVYSDDNGDWGTGKLVSPGQEWSYNLVVYKHGFKTPDWLKNAVIYQIFPDRFFNGDQGNDRAQILARAGVYYEFPGWYMLPENPSVKNQSWYPINAFRGDGQYSNEIYGGDLKGITQKIDYLKALGVTVIYLNPVFHSISNHRYDACDYNTIDPILGTLGDFEELVDAAEKNGMHIVLDGVFNHVSDDSVYFDRYYKFLPLAAEKYDGKIGAYPYWAYVYDLMNEQGHTKASAEDAAKKYFTNVYGITDYSYTEWFRVNNEKCKYSDNIGLRKGKPVYSYEGWWGYDSMPVIFSTNGSEYQTGNWAEEIIYNKDETSVTQYWIGKGTDGWRLDVANEVSDETWQRFRESVKAMNSKNVTVLDDGSTTYDDGDDAAIIGEIWADAAYYLLGDMYDSVMNYPFRDAVAGFARKYRINRDNKDYNLDDDYTAWDALNTLEITRERYPQEAFYAMMNLVGSHDTARILSYLDDVEDDGWKNNTLQNAYPSYANTSATAKKLQYMVALIQFTYPGAPTIYYGDEIGMVGSDDPDDRRAFEWGRGQQKLVEWYALLAQIRSQYSALRTGSVLPIDVSRDVMGYVRRDSKDTFVILANRLGTAQTVRVNLAQLNLSGISTLTDLLTGSKFTVSNGILTATVPAYSGLILKNGSAAKVTLSAGSAAALRPAWTTETVQKPQMYQVTYSWNFSPPGVTLPAGASVESGNKYTVDTTYTKDFSVNNGSKGKWVFSGWSNTGTLTVIGNITLTGKWSYVEAGPGPVQPTNPPQPTTPVVPTTPAQPTVPTVPATPTQPTVPTVPATPAVPTVPTQPGEPTVPTTPVQPSVPVQPTAPVTPTAPAVPNTTAPAPTETTNPEASEPPVTTVPSPTEDAPQTSTVPPTASTEPEAEQITIRVEVPEGWLAPALWAWDNGGNNAFESWPGVSMTKGEDGYWYAEIPAWVENIIINANEGAVKTADLKLEQTGVDVDVIVSLGQNDSVQTEVHYGQIPGGEETTEPTTVPQTTVSEDETDPTVTTTAPATTVPSTQPPVSGNSGGTPWWGILLILLSVAAIGAGGWFGYSYYRKKKS